MLKYLPFIVVGVVMVPLTAYQWKLMDWVWGDNTPAQQCAYLLKTEVPHKVGDWVGVDRPVDPKILEVAGADGYIDRVYTNTKTNEQVSIWLIVGHFRQVARHTPNVCYKAAGFQQVEPDVPFDVNVEGEPPAVFRTAKFMRSEAGGQVHQRVFWAWWRPDPLEEGQSPESIEVEWDAPEDPRVGFGYCRALYKLYFTANSNQAESPGESVALRFAEEFLPIVNEKLTASGVVMVKEDLPADFEEVVNPDGTEAADADEPPGVESPEAVDDDPLLNDAA